MRIYNMTATFGKLEHETLSLSRGLNVFHAPNEWGKSTWCAFLVAMLYGIDTKERSKQGMLADKEKYAPWSGHPMSGRLDIDWNGRHIIIERATKGRSILGDFKAYEWKSGLPVPELTAANCGQMLLGVEKSVFLRSGFIRLTDLPVTQDESLRRRLNALVTTGDESGAADTLAQTLKDLKNKCRFNRSGLLPQAESQYQQLQEELQQRLAAEESEQNLRQRQLQLEKHLAELQNHEQALRYAESQQSTQRAIQAEKERALAQSGLAGAEKACEGLPSREALEQQRQLLGLLQSDCEALQMDMSLLPLQPQQPDTPEPFRNLSPELAKDQVQKDREAYEKAAKARNLLPWILGMVLLAAGAGILAYLKLFLGTGACAVGLVALFALFAAGRSKVKAADALAMRYGSREPDLWMALANRYSEDQENYRRQREQYDLAHRELQTRRQALDAKKQQLTGGESPNIRLAQIADQLAKYNALDDARRDLLHAQQIAESLADISRPVEAPQQPDLLTWTKAETARMISDAQTQQRQLQLQLGQALGRKEKLRNAELLQRELDALRIRIRDLEDHYAALVLAQQTLQAASDQLQRRFAPKLTRRAQELFSQLTDGKYDRLTLGQDMSLEVGAKDEDTLRSALWRSDGTADQLYLALRLAVAEELLPDAPLILDDALVRFDDKRLKKAMEILKQAGETRQVLLFSCQERELTLHLRG